MSDSERRIQGMREELARSMVVGCSMGGDIESPIEEMFLLALLYQRAPVGKFCFPRFIAWGEVRPSTVAACKDAGLDLLGSGAYYDDIALFVQSPILGFRVDFLLVSPRGKVVVELDGHDFHERTKEQARRDKSRDRKLQSAGFRVLRFTGSEVYEDPHRCVDEVLSILAELGTEKTQSLGGGNAMGR